MKVAVVRFPGTNCEFDTQYAFEKLGHTTELVWHEEVKLPAEIDLVVVPGGFSYGDYLRSGSIARFSPVMKAVAVRGTPLPCLILVAMRITSSPADCPSVS